MPRPSRKAALSHRPSLTSTPRRRPREQFHMHARRAAPVAEPHDVALADAQLRGIVGVHQHGRARLARSRGRGFGKTRIEEVARRRRRELEGMRFVGRLVDGPMVGQGRHVAPRPASPSLRERRRRPVRAEMEFAVGMGEAVEIMRRLERRLAVDPARGLEFGERAAARDAQRLVDDLARASCRSRGCSAPRRLASAQITSWLERHSPGGSIVFGANCKYWCALAV